MLVTGATVVTICRCQALLRRLRARCLRSPEPIISITIAEARPTLQSRPVTRVRCSKTAPVEHYCETFAATVGGAAVDRIRATAVAVGSGRSCVDAWTGSGLRKEGTRLPCGMMVRRPSIRAVLGLVVLVLALVGHLRVHADRSVHSHLGGDEGPPVAAQQDARADEADPAQPEAEPHLSMLVVCLAVLSALAVSRLRGWPLRRRLPLRLATPRASRASQAPPDPSGPPTPVAAGVLLRV